MKGFTQVTRKAASAAESLFDPLSMFTKSPPEDDPLDNKGTKAQTTSSNRSSRSLDNKSQSATSPLSSKDNLDYVNVPRPKKETIDTSDLAVPNLSKRESTARSSSPVPTRKTLSSGKLNKEILESPSKPPPPSSPVSLDNFQFMSGESKVMNMNNSSIQLIPSMRHINGVLYMTNYRIVFIPSVQDAKVVASASPSLQSWLQVPLGCIDKVERSKESQPLNGICIVITCKDCRQLKIMVRKSYLTDTDYEVERAYNLITTYAFPNNLKHIFAFNHKLTTSTIPVTLLLEYARLGILEASNYWCVTAVNNDFKLCNTYSEWLIVPRAMTDEDLHSVAAFRSGCRLPVCCWGDVLTGATLWRSAQPKCGMSGSCKQDERFLDIIAQSAAHFNSKKNANNLSIHRREPMLYIVDCRSRASAMANRAAGAGYESQANYPSSRLEFYNIPNIHAVRDSLKAVTSVVLHPNGNPANDVSFTKQIEDSQWLTNARLIIKASYESASQLHRGVPVLVHCSHGWDRTAQVCTLAQLFLDPYYRTMDGFAVLIEKEWCSFGHPFFMRCGHGHEKGQRSEDDLSPIFLQFLDCLWQIVKQFPSYFEFNTRYILTIADHLYSCRFGTFLFSSDQQRKAHMAEKYCTDIWTFFNLDRQPFLNPFYHNNLSSTVAGAISEHHKLFLPPLGQLLRGVSLWSDYFLRWSTVASVPPVPSYLSHALYHPVAVTNDSDSSESQLSISNSTYNNNNLRAADCALYPIVSTEDHWEGMYLLEKQAKETETQNNALLQGQSQEINNILLEFIQSKLLPESNDNMRQQFENLIVNLSQEKGLGVENMNGFYSVTRMNIQPPTLCEDTNISIQESEENNVEDLLTFYDEKVNNEDDLTINLPSNTSESCLYEDDGAEADTEIIIVDQSSSTLAPPSSQRRQSSTVIDDETFAVLV